MDITKMTEIELKALAFDLIGQKQNIDNNLQVIYKELTNRAKPNEVKVAEQPTVTEDVKKD